MRWWLRELGWDALAVILPVLSGVAFYGWNAWHPWTRAICNAPNWIALTWIPFLVVPAVFAGVRARLSGKDRATIITVLVAALVLTAMICFLAFIASFEHQNCGE